MLFFFFHIIAKKPKSSNSPYAKRQCSITTHFTLQWDPFPIMMRFLSNLVVFYAMFIFGFIDTYSNKTKIIFPGPKKDIDVFIWSLRGLYWFQRICCWRKYALVTCLRQKKQFTCSLNIIPNPNRIMNFQTYSIRPTLISKNLSILIIVL